jgi:DNA-directed RNA polymerase specialized sigma24 family protein
LSIFKVYSSPRDSDRRTEFTEFYEASYSTIVGELLALTGGLDHARAVSAGSFSRAWQAWPSIRALAEPEMWVRADAMTRAYAPPRGMRLLQRGLPPIDPVELDSEDTVLVAALQRLPMEQRLPLVLHYMAGVPAELIAEWSRRVPEEIDALLDDGFDTLVALLDWPVDTDEHVEGEEFDWTAEALEDSAQRLPQHITTPPPTISFRHATAVKISKRGAPVGAAAAACVGLVVALSLPGQQPEARPAAFNRLPEVDPFVGPTLAATPLGPYAVEATPPSHEPSATIRERRRPSLAARALPTTQLPVVQAVAAPSPVAVVPLVAPSSPAPTSSTPTVTSPTTPSPAPLAATTTTAVAPSTVIVTVTAPPSTSTPTTTAEESDEEEEVETTTTRPRPSPRPRPTVTPTTTTTTTTSEESEPTEEETITEELPVTTSASEDG